MKKTLSILLVAFLSVQLSAQSISLDKQLGEEGAAQIEQQIGLYEHGSTSEYIDQIGHRLLAELTENPYTFEFHIVNMAEPNAFALPGGHIYVSRGLLPLVNNEDELACVMGHEIIHVMERHSVARMKKGILPAILQLPGQLIGGSVGGAINAPISFFSDLGLANYSRGQEKDADRIGVRISAGAGYDPTTLAEILSRMTQEVELLTGQTEKKSYLSDHPFTPKRVEYLNKLTSDLKQQPKPNIVEGRDVLHKLDGLLYGPDPAQGVFNDSLFLHPDLGLSIVFPGGWITANNPIAVGAMQADGEAVIAMTLESPGVSADSAATTIKAHLNKDSVHFDEKADLDINGYKARSITITQEQDGEKVTHNITWIEKDTTIYRLVGAALEQHVAVVDSTTNSFRRISEVERGRVFQNNIRIIEAKEGETLEALSTRSQNTWSVELTAIFNGMEEAVVLKEGELIKVAVKTNYSSKKN